MHLQTFGESQFYNASSLLGLLLKYAGFGKTMFFTSVRDSGFQQTHIQIFSESQFSNASFLLGFLLKHAGSGEMTFKTSLWDSGFQ